MSARLVYLIAATALFGCASSGTNRTSRQTLSVLTSEEIVKAHADVTTAYDAVARLRPNWLSAKGITSGVYTRGTEYAMVFLDGQQYGDLTALRSIQAYHVGMMRYYDVTQAGARFGIKGGASGVIEVTTKSPAER